MSESHDADRTPLDDLMARMRDLVQRTPHNAVTYTHPSIDNLEIVELKRRRSLVKDEIVRLRKWSMLGGPIVPRARDLANRRTRILEGAQLEGLGRSFVGS